MKLKMHRCGIALPALIACWTLAGCYQVRKSDVPVSKEEARAIADMRLPLTPDATDVRFNLYGKTQDWRLYLSFKASPIEIDKLIEREVNRSNRHRQLLGLVDLPAEKLTHLTEVDLRLQEAAPSWWKPTAINDGFYFGNNKNQMNSPQFWVDVEKSKVFYFKKF